MIIYSGCKSTKKILFTLRFLVFFLRQLVSQNFMFPLLPNAVVNTSALGRYATQKK